MRKEYDLKDGRPNPYYAKLGAKGRRELREWYQATKNVVHLDDDVFEVFPDDASVNAALRLVIELGALAKTKPPRARKPAAKPRKRKAA
jgi:hypothetical protein